MQRSRWTAAAEAHGRGSGHFYLSELTANGVQWQADKNDVTTLITTMSARYPVQ